MNIFFITSTRIGDAILSTSLLNHLSTVHPEARFTIACGHLCAPLFEDFPYCDRLISLHSKKYGRHWLEIWSKAVGIRWDLIIDLRGSAIAFLLWGKKRLIWRSKNVQKHRVEQLIDLLETAGYQVPHPQTQLWISEKRRKNLAAVIPQGSPVIAVAPLANWVGKEWPHDKMVDLLHRLRQPTGPFPGARFAFFAAPNEQDRLAVFKTHFNPDDGVDVSAHSHLLDVAVLMQHCAFFVGNDSGLMHMAASLGRPTLGLFGPSHDVFYRPWGPHAHFIRTPEDSHTLLARAKAGEKEGLMETLSVDAVYEKLCLCLPKS